MGNFILYSPVLCSFIWIKYVQLDCVLLKKQSVKNGIPMYDILN